MRIFALSVLVLSLAPLAQAKVPEAKALGNPTPLAAFAQVYEVEITCSKHEDQILGDGYHPTGTREYISCQYEAEEAARRLKWLEGREVLGVRADNDITRSALRGDEMEEETLTARFEVIYREKRD